MKHKTGNDSEVEDRLGHLILEYVETVQAGHKLDRDAFLRAQPEFRCELETFFAIYDRMEGVAAPLRGVTTNNSPAKALHDSQSPSRGRSAYDRPKSPGDPTSGLGQLGEFHLLREVGRGGMGVVYEAEQITLQRRVALKVLPFAAAIDDRRLQRFKNEALAAAHLRHENIVPVYAVGAELGVHYYAMQFIEGHSLAALIQELRNLVDGLGRPQTSSAKAEPATETAGKGIASGAADTQARDEPSPAADLSRDLAAGSNRYFNWVVGLGRQSAEALEHAHQMGIVHRDIKPANLLLDPRGQLWITDFGLAQISGNSGLTMTGEMLGTLRYASPEQARARGGLVDHRTDIYSLGATLYELLALQPLFEGCDRNELLRQIANDEPRPLRSIRPSVPKELETVVHKALAKEPAERYATAEEMAADLQRFLEHRPILARRPTAVERFRKWARRHPSVAIASGAVLLLLLVGSLVSTVLIHGERKKAEQAYERERERANEAEAQFRLARRSVDELFRVSELELTNKPGAEALRRQLLTSVLSYYQEFMERRGADSSDQDALQETSKRVEKILSDLTVLRATSQLNLLSQPAVLDDLGRDDVQRAKLRELSAQAAKHAMQSFHDFGRVPFAERRRRDVERARANEAALKAILTADQLRRLRQIGLQADVAEAFREPEVAAKLKLTDAQRERIRMIEELAFFDGLRLIWPDKGNRKLTPNESLLQVLTEEQLQAWREITGTPFLGPVGFPPPFNLFAPEAKTFPR